MMGRMAMGLMLSGSVVSCDLASEVMGVRGPRGFGRLNCIVKIGKVGEPLPGESFKFDEAPSVGTCA